MCLRNTRVPKCGQRLNRTCTCTQCDITHGGGGKFTSCQNRIKPRLRIGSGLHCIVNHEPGIVVCKYTT